ncbi:hypothetical protein ART_2019 [Arthrobacter sp. PAMC 25486]|nr:hypothetical protein ART_2019 [Arthrobacter sp. PAMC 25486]
MSLDTFGLRQIFASEPTFQVRRIAFVDTAASPLAARETNR